MDAEAEKQPNYYHGLNYYFLHYSSNFHYLVQFEADETEAASNAPSHGNTQQDKRDIGHEKKEVAIQVEVQ